MNSYVFVDRQVPVQNEVFLDHTAHFYSDLNSAGAQLERLGFSVSGINMQKNLGADGLLSPSGTSNRLVRLRRGFLEILAATHATPLADQLRSALSRYEGIHLLAFSHTDLESQRVRLVQSGFAMQPMIHMRRKAQESGKEVAWSVLRTEPHVMSEGRIQFVYPHTPELSWPAGSFTHPNRADSLTGVIICVGDTDEALLRYANFLGINAKNSKFHLDRGCVKIATLEEARKILPSLVAPDLPFICGVTIATDDLDRTREIIRSNGIVPVLDSTSMMWIEPKDALGCFMGFHQQTHIPI